MPPAQAPPPAPPPAPPALPQAPLRSSGIRRSEGGFATSGAFLFLHILAQPPDRVSLSLALIHPISENSIYVQYESACLQGFEAIGCLPPPLVAGPMYQAVLRQSSKRPASGFADGEYGAPRIKVQGRVPACWRSGGDPEFMD
jgi:hypothetical protein